MTRRILFQLHWALGISAGLVLVVVSVTGVIMAFEDEIMRALSPGIVTLAPPAGSKPLSPDALLARVREQQPDRRVASLTLATAPAESARVVFTRSPREPDADRRSYLDPYDGRLLGTATGEHFFRTTRALHRWLLVPGDGKGWGRPITGVAAFSLVFMSLSGLWLRWPRRFRSWRQWFSIDLRQSGRLLYRSLHMVIGTWLILFYVLSGLTGLWWSFDWYRSTVTAMLTGASAKPDGEVARDADGKRKGGANASAGQKATVRTDALAAAVAAVQHERRDDYREFVITVPKGAEPIHVRALPPDARYDQAYDDYVVAADTGEVLKAERYDERSVGRSLVEAWLSVHRGAYFGLAGRIAMVISTAALPLFAVTGWLLYLDRRRRKRSLVRSGGLPAQAVAADARSARS